MDRVSIKKVYRGQLAKRTFTACPPLEDAFDKSDEASETRAELEQSFSDNTAS